MLFYCCSIKRGYIPPFPLTNAIRWIIEIESKNEWDLHFQIPQSSSSTCSFQIPIIHCARNLIDSPTKNLQKWKWTGFLSSGSSNRITPERKRRVNEFSDGLTDVVWSNRESIVNGYRSSSWWPLVAWPFLNPRWWWWSDYNSINYT